MNRPSLSEIRMIQKLGRLAPSGKGRPETSLARASGLVASTMSIVAGPHVNSPTDAEQTDIVRGWALLATREFEREELAPLHVDRVILPDLAHQVVDKLIARNTLKPRARVALGNSEVITARPIQALLTLPAIFVIGTAMLLAKMALIRRSVLVAGSSVALLSFRGILGMIGARFGGANLMKATLRIARLIREAPHGRCIA